MFIFRGFGLSEFTSNPKKKPLHFFLVDFTFS
jgi:hypothetical protein